MKGNMEERAQELALYIIENKATVRAAAQRFGISKSTVHKDLSERLPAINRNLYQQVKEILNENKAERHIRGGIATRKKYKGEERSADRPGAGGLRHKAAPGLSRAMRGPRRSGRLAVLKGRQTVCAVVVALCAGGTRPAPTEPKARP